MARERQPIRRAMVPDLSDTTLVGSWGHAMCPNGLTDYSPAGNDMTYFGSTKFGQHNSFVGDGASAYLRRAVANYRSADSAGTIECWFKLNAVGATQVLFASCDEATAGIYRLYVAAHSTNVIQIYLSYTAAPVINDIRGSTTLVVDRWYHLVVISTGSVYSAILDGTTETLSISSGSNDGTWFDAVANRDNITIGAQRYNAVASYANAEIVVNVYSESKTADWVATRYEAAIPDDNLKSMVDGSGTERSKNAVAWIPYGNPQYGPAIKMDGTNHYLETVNVITGISAGWTQVLWFRSRVDGQYQLANNTVTASLRSVVCVYAGGEIRAGHWYGGVNYRRASGAGAVAGVWHHVVASFDGDETVILVLDGVQLTSDAQPSSGNAARYTIGASAAGSDRLDGEIDDIRYYLGGRTVDWAQLDYEATRNLPR